MESPVRPEIKDFVKDHELLKEDYRHNKGFAKFEHINIAQRINELSRTCVLALVGPYGSGKSTALHRAKDQLEDTTWLQFDAWRYPERKALWDGLVIEVAKQLGDRNLKKTKRVVDGSESAIGKWGGITTSIFASATDIIPKGAIEWIGDKFHSVIPTQIANDTKGIKDAGPVADKLVKNLFGRSAAKRAYEFEKILTDLLISVKTSRVIIVVEDVDRSGSDGLHFLETLSFYLSNNDRLTKAKKKVIAVAPVSEESYRTNDATYLKCVDYIELFRPRRVDLNNFIEEVFVNLNMHPELQSDFPNMPLTLRAYQTKYFLEGLFNTFPTEMNMRKLKMIIREASSAYRLMQIDGYTPDWLIVLCTQATKHFRDKAADAKNAPSFYDTYTKTMVIPAGTLFANTISAIVDERKQDDEPGQNAIIIPSRRYAQGEEFVIDDNVKEGGMPIPKLARRRLALASQREKIEFCLPGYYFQY